MAAHGSNVILDITVAPGAYENGSYGSLSATYNGFATAIVNGISNQMVICDDFGHTTQVPSGNMIYDFSTLGGTGQLQNARFTGAAMVADYEEAAVLVWELANYMSANGAHASSDAITDYQYALWNIFDPYNSSTNPQGVKLNSAQSTLQSAAWNLVNTESPMLAADVYPNLRIYTPDANGGSASNQEFLQFAAPEPESVVLVILGAALIGGVGAMRKRAPKRAQ